MPPRTNPTARQARLGTELRKLRERAGMTGREAAERLGVSPMQMSHLEVGRIGVSEQRLRRLAAQYGCADEELVDALAAMTRERGRRWWEEYRGVLTPAPLDLAELEHHATDLRVMQVVHVPGLLQTEAYIRAIHTYATPVPPPDYLEAIVDFRLQRRRVLDREVPPQLTVVIHEAALRIKVGDRRVAREQLEFFLEAADRPTVSVRVVPFEVDGFAGSGNAMFYAGGSVPQLDTVQLDTAHGIIFLDAEAELTGYRNLFGKVEKLALSQEDSQDLARRIMRQL
jgi:transcriptional regulator with XRE-family HTH domain